MKKTHYLLGVVAVEMISGCGLLTSPKERAVQKDSAGFYWLDDSTATVFSLTPERRTVLVYQEENDARPIFCAEPPPDVAENIASSLRALAEASGKWATGDTASAAMEFSRSLNTTAVPLFLRSQGVQIFRDGLYNLCQARMNGFITDGKYWELYGKLLENAFALVIVEIPSAQALKDIQVNQQTLNAKSAAEAAMQKAQEATARAEKVAEEAKKALEEIKKKP